MMNSISRVSRHIVAILLLAVTNTVFAATGKPNILVIFGDDIGMWNISAYHRGMMGDRCSSGPTSGPRHAAADRLCEYVPL